MVTIARRALSSLVALSLIAAGVVVVVEVGAAWLGTGPIVLTDTATQTLRRTRWDDATVVWVSVGVGLVGLCCVLVAIVSGAPATVPTTIDGVQLERRPLERVLRVELEALDGVSEARVRAGGRQPHVRIDTNRTIDVADVEEAGRRRLGATSVRFALAREPALNVRARRAEQP